MSQIFKKPVPLKNLYDLFNSFLPANFLGGKATGSLKVSGNVYEPSAVAELL